MPEQRSDYNGCAATSGADQTWKQDTAAGSKRLLCPAAMTWPSAAGAKSSMRSRTRKTTPHQSRGSATYPNATKLVMTAQKSAMVSQQRFRSRRSETHQQAITHWPRSAADAPSHSPESEQRQSKPGEPECTRRSATRRKDPANSQSSATPTRCHEARANSRNDVLTMERCNASGRNQTRVTHQIRHHAPRVSKPHPQSSEQRPHPDATKRDLPGCQNALAKRRCPTRRRFSSVTRRKAPAANRPRNNVASCRQPDAITRKQIKTNSPKIRRGITAAG